MAHELGSMSLSKMCTDLVNFAFQENFTEPTELSQFVHDKGFKGVWMLDPGIKQEKGFFAYDSGTTQGVWVLKNNGQPYQGEFSSIVNTNQFTL